MLKLYLTDGGASWSISCLAVPFGDGHVHSTLPRRTRRKTRP